jgi:hypothetical protein
MDPYVKLTLPGLVAAEIVLTVPREVLSVRKSTILRQFLVRAIMLDTMSHQRSFTPIRLGRVIKWDTN